MPPHCKWFGSLIVTGNPGTWAWQGCREHPNPRNTPSPEARALGECGSVQARMARAEPFSGPGLVCVCVQQVNQGDPWLWEDQVIWDMAPGHHGTMAHEAHLRSS